MTTLLLILAAIALIARLYFRKSYTRLPTGELVYDDAGRLHLERPLVSHRYRLTGKPDYLIDTENGVVPVEIKSTKCPRSGPYDAHIAQLITYCVLAEDVLGKRVPYTEFFTMLMGSGESPIPIQIGARSWSWQMKFESAETRRTCTAITAIPVDAAAAATGNHVGKHCPNVLVLACDRI